MLNTQSQTQYTMPFGKHEDKPLAEVPNMLTDADRLGEIAGLLAAGILRLRCRAALLSPPAITPGPENLPKNSLNDLELSRDSSLSVQAS